MQIRSNSKNQNAYTSESSLRLVALMISPVNLVNIVIRIMINIRIMNTVWRERREMELLTVDQMKDIGLNPVQVDRECRKRFFDIPVERRVPIITISKVGLADFRKAF